MIEDFLARHAATMPDKPAVVCGDSRLTYAQLYAAVQARVGAMEVAGRAVPFRAATAVDTLITYFAIHMAGGVAVPLAKDLPEALFHRYESQSEGLRFSPETADILYTTGTTGQAKGVMISHETILANAENLVAAQGYHADLTFLVNGPLNHIGSLSKVYPTLMVGGTLVLLDGMRDLNAFFAAVEGAAGRVATFLVPASIRMLLAFAERRLAALAEKIEFIETGAAPMAVDDMQRLCRALPKSRLYNTYASTETGIIATFDYNEGDCLAGCLGRPMRHSQLLITADGHVACKGPTLMMGYLDDPELTCRVLHDGMLVTADLGRMDEHGRLRLEGRDGDVINVGGYKVLPTVVEEAALALDFVHDCVCVAAQHPVLGTVLKLLVVTADDEALDKRSLAHALQSRLEAHEVPTFYEKVEAIRRTFNGKINRKSYRTEA